MRKETNGGLPLNPVYQTNNGDDPMISYLGGKRAVMPGETCIYRGITLRQHATIEFTKEFIARGLSASQALESGSCLAALFIHQCDKQDGFIGE